MRRIATARRRVVARMLALVFIGAIAACAGRADRTADSLHTAIPDSASGPGARDGRWEGTDGYSTWHATLDGPAIVQLDEVALYADSTRATRQFRFDSIGLMSMAHEERFQRVYGMRATPDTISTLIELEWMGDSLARAAKRVNGEAKLIQPYEVDNLRAHAKEILILARRGTSPQAPLTPGR